MAKYASRFVSSLDTWLCLLQVYPFSSNTAQQHERRALMACLLLPPVQTFTLVLAAALLLKLRRDLGYAAMRRDSALGTKIETSETSAADELHHSSLSVNQLCKRRFVLGSSLAAAALVVLASFVIHSLMPLYKDWQAEHGARRSYGSSQQGAVCTRAAHERQIRCRRCSALATRRWTLVRSQYTAPGGHLPAWLHSRGRLPRSEYGGDRLRALRGPHRAGFHHPSRRHEQCQTQQGGDIQSQQNG